MIKKIYTNITTFTICFCILSFYPLISFGYNDYEWSISFDSIVTNVNNSETIAENSSNPLNLDCGSAVLIEQNSGKVLYNHNMHEQLRPASVTKIMTILLIMEAIDSGKINYDTQIPCSEKAASMGGSQIWLDTTETLTVDEMLKAICVVSANEYDVQN